MNRVAASAAAVIGAAAIAAPTTASAAPAARTTAKPALAIGCSFVAGKPLTVTVTGTAKSAVKGGVVVGLRGIKADLKRPAAGRDLTATVTVPTTLTGTYIRLDGYLTDGTHVAAIAQRTPKGKPVMCGTALKPVPQSIVTSLLPVAKPAPKPVTKPAPKPVTKPAPKPATRPVPAPVKTVNQPLTLTAIGGFRQGQDLALVANVGKDKAGKPFTSATVYGPRDMSATLKPLGTSGVLAGSIRVPAALTGTRIYLKLVAPDGRSTTVEVRHA